MLTGDVDVRASMAYLGCLEASLATVCGAEVAAWQRSMTTEMMALTALSPDCTAGVAKSTSPRYWGE